MDEYQGFSERINKTVVAENRALLYWMGQAGFALKTHEQEILCIDPYLSDSLYHKYQETWGYGFKRLSPPICSPHDFTPDYLLISHEHGDHLDIETDSIMLKSGKTTCWCNSKSAEILTESGSPKENIGIIREDDKVKLGNLTITVLKADHGDACTDALGFIIETASICIYYAGDTAYNESIFSKAKKFHPDTALLPINGAFGNLNGEEAAKAASKIGCSICIPYHFWTFPLHGGNPLEAADAFKRTAPKCRLMFLTPGEGLCLPMDKGNPSFIR